MDGRGLLVAADVRPRRVGLLQRDARAQAAPSRVRLVRLDAATPLPFGPVFDLRAARRAVLGPRHDPPRPRDSLAPHGRRPAAPRRGAGRDAGPRRRGRAAGRPPRLRHLLERAGGERGPSSRRSSRATPSSASANPVDRAPRGRRLAPLVNAGRPPAHLALPARPRGVLRRGPGAPLSGISAPGTSHCDPSTPAPCTRVRVVVRCPVLMALTTRVWSAGKLLLLIGALVATYVVSAALAARVALPPARCRCPCSSGSRVTGASAALADLGLTLKVDESRRADPKIPAGPDRAAGTAAPGTVARRGRSVKVWLSTGGQAPPVPKLVGESERAARSSGCSRTASRVGARLGDPVERLPGRHRRRRRIPPRRAARAAVSLLVNRGERGDVLRDARPDWRQRRPRGRRAARRPASASPSSRRTRTRACRRRRHPPVAAGRLPGDARRHDFARGEPVTIRLAPSILAADFAALGEAIAAAERGGADLIHVDVMDGHFVPNLTVGPPVVRSLKRVARVPARRPPDDHRPGSLRRRRSSRPARRCSRCTSRSLPHLNRTLALHQGAGREGRRRASTRPRRWARSRRSPADVDYVLVMSVNPGFGGQAFLPRSASKVRSIRALLDRAGNSAPIEIDGGIDLETVGRVVRAGAEILVAGSAIFHAPDIDAAARALTGGRSRPRPAARRGCPPPARDVMPADLSPRRRDRARARPLRRDRQDGRRLLRELPRLVRGGRCEWLRATRAATLPAAGGGRHRFCRSSRRTASTAGRRATTTSSRSGRRARLLSPARAPVRLRDRADAASRRRLAAGYTVHAASIPRGGPRRLPPT